jgi:hypothetical protein
MIEIVLIVLVVGRYAVDTIKNIVDRWLIKNVLSENGTKIPMLKWFNWEYLTSRTLMQYLSLAFIASFTLVTFPLGIWIQSFEAWKYWHTQGIIVNILSIIFTPLTALGFWGTVHELKLTQTTIFGLAIVEFGFALCVVGWYFVGQGNL